MIGDRDRGAWPSDRATGETKSLKSLGARNFVHQVAVDVEDRGSIGQGFDHVIVPDLIE